MAAAAPLEEHPLSDLIGYQVRRLSLLSMADFTTRLEPLGLRPTEASVLFAIAARPGVTQSEVGRHLGIKRANMAPLIAGLEARGLVSRKAVDGRSQALRLTSDGCVVNEQARAAARDNEARCFGLLTDAERLRLAGQLRSLWERLDG